MQKPPRINVTRSSMPPFEEYVEELHSIWESHWLTNMGEKHNALEAALRPILDAEQVALFTNGHSALEMVLQGLELEGEVITTPFSFASTTHAIVRRGLTPVFADIRESDCTLDPDKIEALITPRTCAILPVHVYGNLCAVDAIDEIAARHGLKVVYDAAHAFGVRKNGRGVGAFGDAAMFSFHATKVFHTIEGGAVACHSEALHKRLFQLRDFGIADEEHVTGVGGNAKMNEFCAAMGLCNLRHLDAAIAARRTAVQRYCKRLAGVPGVRVLLAHGAGLTANYAYMPVAFDPAMFGETRDEICARLAEHNIGARKYFYPLITDFDCYRGLPGFDSAATPVAQRIASQVVTLPLYEELSEVDVDRICDLVLQKH